MKRFLIGFAFCFLQLAAFSFCSGDEPVPAHFTEWKAETIVEPFWTRRNWKKQGASRSFPNRPC